MDGEKDGRVAGLKEKPQILVDADACPVKAEVLKVAERLGVAVTLVSNGGMRPSRDPMVVTTDIPLAARAVALGAHVLGPTGRPFTPETIGMAVAMRDLKQHLRETGESKGYNAAFTPRDRSRFLEELDRTLRRALKAATT